MESFGIGINGDTALNGIDEPRQPHAGLKILASLSNSDFNVYKIGVPLSGTWTEILNSNSTAYDGTGVVNGTVTAQAGSYDGYGYSISVNLPARTFIVLKHNTVTAGIENYEIY